MRSILFQNLKDYGSNSTVSIEGDQAHHLIKSVRINVGEKVLLLDGQGSRTETTVTSVTKHEVGLSLGEVVFTPATSQIDLAICCSKKDAMEEIIRNAVELGISRITPVLSRYAQRDYQWNSRLERIAESALIQSNNSYFPQVEEACSWENFLAKLPEYQQVFYFSSQQLGGAPSKQADRCLMIIGPEAGMSEDEEKQLLHFNNMHLLHLNTPIMRAPTALCTAVGWLKALGF